MTEQQYLERHIAKADLELRKIAFPYKRGTFQDDLRTKYIIKSSKNIHIIGHYSATDNYIAVDPKYFSNAVRYKRKYCREIISILQHEIIHKYIDFWLDDDTLHYCADNSPAFLSILAFFNSRGCNIEANYTFAKDFKTYNKELYTFATDKNTTFMQLIIKLQKIADNIKNHFSAMQKIEDSKTEGAGYSSMWSGNELYTTAKLTIQRFVSTTHTFTVNSYICRLSTDFNVTDLECENNKEILEWITSNEGLATEGEVEENEDVVIEISA